MLLVFILLSPSDSASADFDGDSVTAIPHIGTTRVRSTPPLKGLKGFEPKRVYPAYPGMKRMGDTQAQMGKISNLITGHDPEGGFRVRARSRCPPLDGCY
ncbi:hypothetical protein [Siphovirus 29632]|nr:hypothetical protein [Siphovirus 29632]